MHTVSLTVRLFFLGPTAKKQKLTTQLLQGMKLARLQVACLREYHTDSNEFTRIYTQLHATKGIVGNINTSEGHPIIQLTL